MPFDICSKHLKVIKDINIKIIIKKKHIDRRRASNHRNGFALLVFG